jgi:NAD(P)-dependent dehydrogenase (short-subunit alcohol dehydrogenase family)
MPLTDKCTVFPSDMAQPLIVGRDFGKETLEDAMFIPARRIGGEEEMGGSVLYLASRAGAFCNGLILLNDGGRLSIIPASY